MKLLLIAILFVTHVSAKDYEFASVEHSFTIEVGSIVLPQIYKKLGHASQVVPLSAGRAELAANSGLRDGEVMRIKDYGKSNPQLIRVPTPYYQSKTMAYVRKNSHFNIDTPSDLIGYSVAKVRGVKHSEIVTKDVKKVHDSNSTAHILKQLSTGLVDVAITAELDGRIHSARLNVNNVRVIDNPLNEHYLYHYLHKNHAKLVPKIDQVIKEMKASGELNRLIHKAEQMIIAREIKSKY